jgi:hypothetical protein
MLVVANDLGNRADGIGQLVPMVEKTETNGFEPREALIDTGYYFQSEVNTPEEAGLEAFVAVERQAHARSLASIFGEEEHPPETPDQSPGQKMKNKLSTPQGRERYALRKQAFGPVFGGGASRKSCAFASS